MKTEIKYVNENSSGFAFFSICSAEIFCSLGIIQINSTMKRRCYPTARHHASVFCQMLAAKVLQHFREVFSDTQISVWCQVRAILTVSKHAILLCFFYSSFK